MILQDYLKNIEVILGSKSPRRNDLLASMDIAFKVEVKEVNEDFDSLLSAEDAVKSIALNKLKAFDTPAYQNKLIICADTIVVDQSGTIIGKPVDLEDAKQVIFSLKDNEHTVFTAVAISFEGKKQVFVEQTKVWFYPINQEEISYYVEKYKPLDKAGSYGIQEWIGRIAIHRIEGSYENVIGLPTARLQSELKQLFELN